MSATASKFHGVITALVTPFKKGEIDWASFRRLLRSQVQHGVNGLVINGTTGESPTLTIEEVQKLYEMARAETGGQMPIIVGTGSNSTNKTAELTWKVSIWKPDAVLVVVPYYNKPPQRGMRAHFEEVARNSGVPVMLYNVPGRTIAALEPSTTGQLSRVENIVGIKDATGDMAELEALKRECQPGFALLSGDDATCADFSSRGGHGVIAVASHVIGHEMVEYLKLAAAGDQVAIARYREKYAPLFKWLYCEANPIPVKMALHFMGILDSPELRLPLAALDEKYHEELKSCLRSLGKI